MEIRPWLYYAVINCVLVCCTVGKTISLNKLIEAESDQKVQATISPKLQKPEPAAERFSLNKGLKPLSRISKIFKTGTTLNLIPLGKKISPLKYRKTFQIKSPLKPKRVKLSLRTRHKRKNQSVKREIDSNATINQKYIPLLKSLGMLFDNILGPDSGESFEITKHKKRLRYIPERDGDVPCKCPRQESNAESESKEETVTSTEAPAPEVSTTTEAAPEIADNTPAGDLRSFRRNKNVPLLLSRNTFGPWRNNNGFSERSHTAHNGSAERDISGDNGDSKHNPTWGQDESSAKSNEEHTNSDSRNNASGVRSKGAIRGRESRNNTEEVYEKDAITKDENKIFLDGNRSYTTEHNGENKLETRRNETKSAKLLPKPIRRQRGFLSEDKDLDFAEPIQSKEDNKESDVSLAFDSTDDKRIFDGNGAHSTETQKTNSRHETVTQKSPNLEMPQYVSTKSMKTSRTKGPVVVIIDGYSVTRHKNGENKLAEKTIHIHNN